MRESVSLRSATVGFRRSAECRVLLPTYEFVDAVPREFPLKERFFSFGSFRRGVVPVSNSWIRSVSGKFRAWISWRTHRLSYLYAIALDSGRSRTAAGRGYLKIRLCKLAPVGSVREQGYCEDS